MKRFRMAACSAGFLLALTPLPLMAQDPMRYEVMQRHLATDPAQLRIIANTTLSNVELQIAHCGPTLVRRHFARMNPGEVQTVQWEQPEGVYDCQIVMDGASSMGTPWSVRNRHEFVSTSPIQLNVNLRELAPDVSDVMLHATRPFHKASIIVTAEDGSVIDSVERDVAGQKDFRLSWTPSEKRPALLEIKISDSTGAWATNTIFYFKIPHTDIVFDTAKHIIRPDQEPYLQESLDKILDIIRTHQRVAVDLYITGYTDTVGSQASNDALSLERAKSIASWFRSRGLSIDTYYRGVGERSLAVPTPDETPNEKNRRAVYILSNQPPADVGEFGRFVKL